MAQIDIAPNSGMGRVAFHWRNAFLARGHEFLHVGLNEVGPPRHPALFPLAAFRRAAALQPPADVTLVHEPAAALFALTDPERTAVFSHGLERRAWELETIGGAERMRTQVFFPLWRLIPSDIGLAKAKVVFVLNSEDHAFACSLYARSPSETFQVSNGVTGSSPDRRSRLDSAHEPRILFLGTWLHRKGISTLVEAASLLSSWGVAVHWVLAGTGVPEAEIRRQWPARLQAAIEVLPTFRPAEEAPLLDAADIFVLPSFFEGQPLALLQAMAEGLCCVVSRIGPHQDLMDDGVDGLLHAPGNAESLARALARCARDPRLRKALGAAAQRRTRNRTWERCSNEIVNIVESRFTPRGDGDAANPTLACFKARRPRRAGSPSADVGP